MSLDAKKSPDIFGTTPKLLQIGAPILCEPISKVINKSLKLGTFPTLLKIAKVIPIFKAGSKALVSNYRPISLLPLVSKIFEKVMYNRLSLFFQQQKILYKKQFGFQKGKSTELALIDLVANVISSLEKGETPCAVFLDFAKAFDTVDHSILVQKLIHYGVRGAAINWISSYLSGRSQCVSIGNSISKFSKIETGVPQGSILGPLLFLIYINDIVNSSDIVRFILFADDTSVFFSHKDRRETEKILNIELHKLSNWLTANKLSLNTDKSSVLFFRTKNANNNLDSNISINGTMLKEVISAKYLGLQIDNKLTFNEQITSIKTKLIKGNYILSKLRHFVPQDLLLNVYNAYIQPFLDYGNLVWCMASPSNLKILSTLQKKSMKIIKNIKNYQTMDAIFKDGKILPIDLNIKLASAKLIWKFYNVKLPLATNEIFQLHGVERNNRDDYKYIKPFCKTEVAKKFVTFDGIHNWNFCIPQNILKSKTITSFKKNYKSYLLESFVT